MDLSSLIKALRLNSAQITIEMKQRFSDRSFFSNSEQPSRDNVLRSSGISRVFLRTFSLLLIAMCTSCASIGIVCTPDWKVTGYYSPDESEYGKDSIQSIHVQKVGNIRFKKKFLKDVRLEGWGKTRFGWYLGYYSKKWHKSNDPLDSQGNPLTLGAVAVDKRYLRHGSIIKIPDLLPVLGQSTFVATDTGSAIKNKHIDVYTGEGTKGKKTSWAVTGTKDVCVASI